MAASKTPEPVFKPYLFKELPVDQMRERASSFYDSLNRRRTIRDFSSRPVPRDIIENCLKAAGTAPSGANMQPWHFAVVQDAEIKAKIRSAAEEEERSFYQERAPAEWLAALAPLGTDADKPFLESAPFLIAIFQQRFGELPDGTRVKHYYATESVGIATGMLIAAINEAGLSCLTHTPSPMGFLTRILGRPRNERPFLLLVVGYPKEGALVPDISRKALSATTSFH